MNRPSSPGLDELIGTKFAVLDSGFVRVIDYMGNDAAIVQAARVSYGVGTKTIRQDKGLIRHLMRHAHTSPFEMCEIKLHVRVPMDCWRQWIRHRTASVNEYSTRYSEAIDDCQTTRADRWRQQSSFNKQGSSPDNIYSNVGQKLSEDEQRVQGFARAIYNVRINQGVAREQARKDLPLSTYTEAYWKIDLHNLMHFLALRLDSHAQVEIRDYATCIANIVEKWVPMTWGAFQDYRLDSVTLTPNEQVLLRKKLHPKSTPMDIVQLARELHLVNVRESDGDFECTYTTEMQEYIHKLELLGLSTWDTPGMPGARE